MRHQGQAVTRSGIVEQVWKLNVDTMTSVANAYINYLRRKSPDDADAWCLTHCARRDCPAQIDCGDDHP